MDTRRLMEQLLKSGTELLGQAGMNPPASSASSSANRSASGKAPDLASFLGGAGGGALAGGALGLLLGNKKARKVGKKVAVYGGLAALGVVAYKAYSHWQQNQSGTTVVEPPQTVDRLEGPRAEAHSEAILKALIGAAKADGHIDQRERELIDQAIARLSPDPELQHWFDRELQKPLDPAEVAAAARSPEMAAEMYLASLLVIDEESFMEKAYLQELARQLRLDPGLVREIERQAEQARPMMAG